MHIFLAIICVGFISVAFATDWSADAKWIGADLELADTAVIPELNFEDGMLSGGWQVHGTGTMDVRESDDGHVMALNYDFREAIDAQFRYYWDKPQDLRKANGLRFRVKGDGSGQMLRIALICGSPQVDAEVFGRRVPILLEFTGWKEFFIPWEDFYLVPEYRDRISILVFMMDCLNSRGPQQGTIKIDDVAFTDQPARPSGFVELESDAAFFQELELSRPELSKVRKAVEQKDWDTAKTEFVHHMRGRKKPTMFLNASDREKMIALHEQYYGAGVLTNEHWQTRRQNWLDQNISYINLKIDGPMKWDESIPGVNGLQLAVLQRFGWLPELGQAYWATDDDRYAEKAVEYIHSFNQWRMGCEILGYKENAPRASWGWPRDIDVAHRAQNWLRTYPYIKNHALFSDELQFEMFKALFHHGQWLYASNLPGFESWNHQIFRSIGLAEIAILMPEFKRANEWRSQAFAILQEHLERETLEDGAYFELTPGYGGGVANAFMMLVHLARLNAVLMPEGFEDRALAMVNWFAGQVAPNGSLPATGDVGYGFRASKVLATGAAVEHRADWKFLSMGQKLESDFFWLLGPEQLKRYSELTPEPPDWTAAYLPASGFITFRSGWEPDSHYAFLNASVEGGGHAHPDSLQIDLHAYGEGMVGDPGIHGWTDPDFEFLDSTRAHSLLQIDRRPVPTVDPVVMHWDEESATAMIQYPDGARHQRTLGQMDSGAFVIRDRVSFSDSKEHQLEQIWRAAPGREISFPAPGQALVRKPDGPAMLFIQLDGDCSVGPDKLKPDLESVPEAGVFSKTVVGAGGFLTLVIPLGKDEISVDLDSYRQEALRFQ